MEVLTFAGQYGISSGWHMWAHVHMPLNILFLFAAFLFLVFACGWKQSGTFIYLCFVFVGAPYFISGIAKLPLGWLSDNQVQLLLPATYANGWLGFLSPEQVGSITNAIGLINPALKCLVILIECVSPFLIYFGRRMALVILGLLILFHVGVLGLSGIFFWQWIGICFCLIILMWKTKWYEAV
ncbi:MAG: hypothetical protein O3C20_04160 [Verrucomicrobia bacterium]|nr:hypothetical protein [Verrucomicrobiota bacterium]